LWWALIICFIYLDTDINSSSVIHNPNIRFIPVWKIQFQLMSSVQRKDRYMFPQKCVVSLHHLKKKLHLKCAFVNILLISFKINFKFIFWTCIMIIINFRM
jgi:hypothetical protein